MVTEIAVNTTYGELRLLLTAAEKAGDDDQAAYLWAIEKENSHKHRSMAAAIEVVNERARRKAL